MVNPKVVFLTGLNQAIIDEVVSYVPEGFDLTVFGKLSSELEQIEAIKDADFLLCYGMEPTDSVVRSAQECKLVQLLAAGYDRMNLKLLQDLEIPLANNGGANSWAVSDHAVLLMLTLYKQLLAADTATKSGEWSQPITGQNTFEMAGKTVGILGIGNIGKQVARRVQAFDAEVQYFDKYPMDNKMNESLNVKLVSLDQLFISSDIISCHTPLTKETHHIVNLERLELMKPSSVLINTSRGPVVDELALIKVLQEGKIAGAGLDVFEQEPIDSENPLLKMDNVVATPHMAGTTWDTWARRAQFGFQNMERILRGEAPQAVVRDFDS